MSDDVAIVGLGIHPFGRHDGVSGPRDGRGRGARRARATPASAGRTSSSPPAAPTPPATPTRSCRCSASPACRSSTCSNGCATGGSALATAHAMLERRRGGARARRRLRQAPAGRVQPAARGLGPRLLVRRDRPDAHHAVLRHEDPALHGRARRSASRRSPRWPRRRSTTARATPTPGAGGRSPRTRCSPRKMVNHPLTQYMFCSPGEGAVALVLARGERAQTLARTPVLPALGRLPHPPLRLLRGVQPVDPDRRRRRRRRPRRPRPRSSRPASAPRTSTSRSCRTPSPAPRSCTSPRPACASTASRRR